MSDVPRSTKAEFDTILQSHDERDVGLERFDERLEQLTLNANDDGGSFSDLIDPGIEVLNNDWLYHDDIAIVSGRVFLIDGSIKDTLIDKWGEPMIDAEGRVSFYVDDQELISFGIIDTPHGDRIDESRIAARIGYGFVLPGGSNTFPQLVVYPGEAAKHVYALPTPESIDARLHNEWPEIMAVVDKLIPADDRAIEKVPRRLRMLARRLSPQLSEQPRLREWLNVYINQRLDLNHQWPYRIKFENELFLLDDGDNEDWLEMTIDEPATVHARKPRIEFIIADSDKSAKAVFFAELPDSDNEWDGMPIGIVMDNILKIRSTRPYRSLVDYALIGSEREIEAALRMSQSENEDDHTEAHVPGVSIDTTVDTDALNGEESATIREMKRLDAEIQAAIKAMAPLYRVTYDTFEQAEAVSRAISTESGQLMLKAGVGNYMLELEGTGAVRVVTTQPDEAPTSGELKVAIDPERPWVALQHGDSFGATFEAILGDVETVEDESGLVIGYRAAPKLIYNIKTVSNSLMTYKTVSMMDVQVTQRGYTQFDGATKIMVMGLERYRRNNEARSHARASYGKSHPVTKSINRLYDAFLHETDNGYQPLKRVSDIRTLADFVEQNPQESDPARNALESILVNRALQLNGIVHDATGEYMEYVDGIVADLTTNTPDKGGNDLYVVVLDRQTGEYRYMLARTIRAVAF